MNTSSSTTLTSSLSNLDDLSIRQLTTFYREGFLIGEGLVNSTWCAEALREINRSLGEPPSAATGATPLDKQIWTSTTITRLFNDSPSLRSLCGLLLGRAAHDLPFLPAVQVALRFPGTLCLPQSFEPLPFWPSFWHIDGLPSPENGIPLGAIRNFTLLVGVCLQDVPAPLAGNLVLFPRSHHLTARYFRDHGFHDALRGLSQLPPLPLADPLQVTLRRGDVVIAHYSLCHSIAPNTSPDIRAMAYFRLNVRPDGAHHPEPMLDPWLDFHPRFRALQQQDPGPPVSPHSDALSPATAAAGLPPGAPTRRPGYIDLVSRAPEGPLAAALAHDAERAELLLHANKLFDAGQWAECAAPMCRLADERPLELLLCFKAGLCCTAGPKERLPEGERRLRRLTETLAPSYTNGWIVLARNLQRQALELGGPDRSSALALEAVECAITGLLHKPLAADVAVEAVKVLVDAQCDEQRLRETVALAQQRYPALAEQIEAAGRVDPVKRLWVQGQRWLAAPDPKDVAEGLRIFGEIVQRSETDYWARVLNGCCLIFAGRPVESLPLLSAARAIDPRYPHGYVVAAQALKLLGRKFEALELIRALLAMGTEIKCEEPDHFQKIIDAIQLCADCLLPNESDHYHQLRSTAIAIFPQLSSQLMQIQKKDTGCLIS